MLLTSFGWIPALAAAFPNPAAPSPSPSPEPTCGDLIREAHANGYARAIDVYNCWITVPFNPAVASRFVTYWNDTLQFQGTLEYLKDPPTGYQQPAVDLLAGLNEIQHAIDTGNFHNQYQFEAALQSLLYSAHDTHVSLNAGLLSSFYFGSSYGLTCVSLDGVQLPKVYLTADLVYNQTKTDESWQPFAISHINGTDVIDHLTRFAALNSYGTAEPHADWNLLFDNPVIDVLHDFAPLWAGGTTFYPGDNFTYTFEDGSTLDDEWLAVYFDPGDTGPLETGGDFYNFFVLGIYPASYVAPLSSNQTTNDSSAPAPTRFNSNAFPQPNIWQPNLTETGYTTGYFLPEDSLAVLSIPTFWADEDAIEAFSDTVNEFLVRSKAANLSKVVIDLQQNEGGDLLLAYSVFKQFFPSIEPFAGSNMREHRLADIMGSLITSYYDTQDDSSHAHQVASADEWIATTRLNAETGRNFTSWEELYDQGQDDVDSLSSTIRLNTSNYLYDYSALGQTEPPRVLLTSSTDDAPFAAENIIMLSDGLCASACSLFMEMMHWDAGVKNVVVGGRPSYGPMQTPSGSRAARYYAVTELDIDVSNAISVQTQDDPVADSIFPNRTNQDVYIYDAGISLRNQVREGETTPLQMQFEAAECRIFYTPLTFNNFTNLWRHAADATWTNPHLCVQGSTGFARSKGTTPKPAPALSPLAAVNYSDIGVPTLRGPRADIPFLVSDQPLPDGWPPEARAPPRAVSGYYPRTSTPHLKPDNRLGASQPVAQGVSHRGTVPQRIVAGRSPPSTGRRLRKRSATLSQIDLD